MHTHLTDRKVTAAEDSSDIRIEASHPNRRNLLLTGTAVAASTALGALTSTKSANSQQPQAPAEFLAHAADHYHPKGKTPSSYTVFLQKGLRSSMPFDDKLDFEEAKKGSSPRRRTNRSKLKQATSLGTWESMSSCCMARTSTAFIRRCNVKPS